MIIFQKPNKRLIATMLAGSAMLKFRRSKYLSKVSQFLFVMSLNQWSKAEYISGASKFRKTLGAAGIFAARTFATYRKRNNRK